MLPLIPRLTLPPAAAPSPSPGNAVSAGLSLCLVPPGGASHFRVAPGMCARWCSRPTTSLCACCAACILFLFTPCSRALRPQPLIYYMDCNLLLHALYLAAIEPARAWAALCVICRPRRAGLASRSSNPEPASLYAPPLRAWRDWPCLHCACHPFVFRIGAPLIRCTCVDPPRPPLLVREGPLACGPFESVCRPKGAWHRQESTAGASWRTKCLFAAVPASQECESRRPTQRRPLSAEGPHALERAGARSPPHPDLPLWGPPSHHRLGPHQHA
jgi:hypothetical protein